MTNQCARHSNGNSSVATCWASRPVAGPFAKVFPTQAVCVRPRGPELFWTGPFSMTRASFNSAARSPARPRTHGVKSCGHSSGWGARIDRPTRIHQDRWRAQHHERVRPHQRYEESASQRTFFCRLLRLSAHAPGVSYGPELNGLPKRSAGGRPRLEHYQ